MRACREKLAPFAGFHELSYFAADEIALQRAYMADVEAAVQVIDLMHERSCQQILAGFLKRFAFCVLRPNGDLLGSSHLLAKSRQAEAAFFAGLGTLAMNHLRVN